MSIFKFTIYDFHETHEVVEVEGGGYELVFKPNEEDGWLSFDLAIDYNFTQVTGYRDFVLFNDGNPIKCTKVFLSDGSIVFAVRQFDTFEKNLNQFKEAFTGIKTPDNSQ